MLDKQELYSLIFTDSFVANIVFCFSGEIAIETVTIFDDYNLIVTILLASCAAISAYIINYIFGRVIFNILKPIQREQGEINSSQLRSIEKSNLLKILLSIAIFSSYGKFIVFFAGFARLQFRYILVASIITKLLYYSYLIFL